MGNHVPKPSSLLCFTPLVGAYVGSTCYSQTNFRKERTWQIFRSPYLLNNLGRGNTDTVGVAVEEHTLALTLGTLGSLDPLAGAGAGPQSLNEASHAAVGLGAVVIAHDGLDSLAGLVGVVERDAADVVVQHVGLDDTVEDVAADEAEVTVDSGGSTAGKVPYLGLVVGEGWVGVLEESDGHC